MRFEFFALIALGGLGACASQPLQAPSGRQTFETHCASCHGPQGAGDGPVAAALAMPVPNLQVLSRRNGGIFPADAVASYIDGRRPPAAHGTRRMPVWGSVFDATAGLGGGAETAAVRIEALLTHLRELQVTD